MIRRVLGVGAVLALGAGCGSSSTKAFDSSKLAGAAAATDASIAKAGASDTTEPDAGDGTGTATGNGSTKPQPFCDEYEELVTKMGSGPFDDTGKQELRDLANTLVKDAPKEIAAATKRWAPAAAAALTSTDDPTALRKKAVAFAKDHAKDSATVNGYGKRVCLGI